MLGPRQTGKSTLIRSLSPALTINLAHEPPYLEFARNPSELERRLAAGSYPSVFIDEAQRLPILLNTLQALLDERQFTGKLYLTGSSARKLRRGHANLLPGRIHTYRLGPLVSAELNYPMDVPKALETGTLPGIWTEQDPRERRKTLRSYASPYLKEEIQAEALTKNIEGFSRFLFVAAADAGKFLDLLKLSSSAGIPRQSAVRYFEILEDTLILRRCEAFRKSERRRLVQSPRLFFFNQISDSAAAKDQEIRISSYRTEHGAEVDFIVEMGKEVLAVEVKASSNVGRNDLRGLRSFADYYGKKHRPCEDLTPTEDLFDDGKVRWYGDSMTTETLAAVETDLLTPRRVKWGSIIAFALMHAAAALALFHFSWKGFWAFFVLQWLTGGLGICLCYHRLLTHRSFTLWKPLEYLLALCGCLAYQNGPVKWVAIHRLHHARSDRPNDPHSPTKGFWWAHMGWLFVFDDELDKYENYKTYAPDLAKDPVLRFMNATHGVYQPILGIFLYLWGGWPAVLWGIFLRTVFMWHATWLVNSASHTWGYKIWATGDQSTNNWWVALLTYGEGWHNNHHAFLRSAAHGLRWWELDATYLTVRLLAALGLAGNVQLPSPEMRERMAREPAAAAAA